MKYLLNKDKIITVLFFICSIFLKNLYLYYEVIHSVYIMPKAYLLTLGIISAFTILLLGMKKNLMYFCYFIFDVFLSSITYYNQIYFRLNNNTLSFLDWNSINNTNYHVINNYWNIFRVQDYIYIADIFILLVILLIRGLGIVIKKMINKNKNIHGTENILDITRKSLSKIRDKKINSIKKFDKFNSFLKCIFLSILILMLCFFSSITYIKYSDKEINNKNTFSNLGVYMGNIADFLQSNDYETKEKNILKEKEEIKDYFTSVQKEKENEFTGIAKNKNVIILQEESLSNYIIGLKINEQEITPNLNKLVINSYYNSNFYSQVDKNHSLDAEFTILNGLYPSTINNDIYYKENKFNSFINIMNYNGYKTIAASGYGSDDLDRNEVMSNFGFNEVYSFENYMLKDNSQQSISDEELITQTIDKVSSACDGPFMLYLTTSENEIPYNISGEYEELSLNETLTNSRLGKYLQSVHKVDKSISVLVNKLKESGLYDNTMIIITSNYSGDFNKQDLDGIINFKHDYMSDTELDKVPFIIHVPTSNDANTIVTNEQTEQAMNEEDAFNIKKFNAIDTTLSSQIDISKTLINLLGIKDNRVVCLGNDILNKNIDKKVLLSNKNILTNRYIIESDIRDNLNIIDIRDGSKIEVNDNIKEEYDKVKKLDYYSEKVLETNLIN